MNRFVGFARDNRRRLEMNPAGGHVTTPTGLQIDLAIAHLSTADPVMRAIAEWGVLQAPQEETRLFESLVSAIVSQQLSGKAAETILRRVRETVAGGGEMTPELVLATDHEAFRAAGLSNQKARYLRELATAVQSGALNLEAIDALEDEAVVEQLTRVKGIGRWTAEMFLLFTLQRPNVLSVGDLGIRNAVKRHYGLAELPTPDELRTIAAPWHPYCSTALLLLWASLDNAPPVSDGAQAAS
jgi:DNA-3-methyladenine glycosylase II